MEAPVAALEAWGGCAKRFLHRLMAIGENRFELLVVEAQEERDRLMQMLFLAIGAAALGMLAGIVFTGALVLIFWHWSHVGTLLILGVLYAGAAAVLCRRVMALFQSPQAFTATLEQIRKDRQCLEETTS